MQIDVRSLTKRHGARLSVDAVTFHIPEGTIAGLLGPNGAGKSTTIRMLTGLARPTEGTASIGGFDVQREHERIRPHLGFLPEQAPVYPEMTARGFLLHMAGIKRVAADRLRAEADRVLELLGLGPVADRLVGNLSKGTRQRVGIAQALLGAPRLVILDEPTVGLDPAQILDVRRILSGLRGRCTVLLSTHILPEVEQLCDQLVVLHQGRVVLHGATAELTAAEPSTGTTELHILAGGDGDALAAAIREALPACGVAHESAAGGLRRFTLRGPVPGAAWRPLAVAALVRAGAEIHEVAPARRSLEEVFLGAVRGKDQDRAPLAR
jgi:ABC-2 type transport system ATP-binding protein